VTFDDVALGPNLVFAGDGTDANQAFDSVVMDYAGAGGDSDSQSIEFNNDGEDLDENDRTVGVDTIDLDDNLESVSIEIIDGGLVTIGELLGDAIESLTVVANSSLTISDPLESEDITEVDASGSTGDVSVSIAFATGDATMTGGAGDDTLTGGEGDDQIDGGDGADTISGGEGEDELDAGDDDETDTFRFAETADVTANSPDTIANFVGGDDVLSFDGDNTFDLVGGNTLSAHDGATNSFAETDNVVSITTEAASLNSADAATAIGSATGAYAAADRVLFIVNDGDDSAVFLFVSTGANALVSAAELGAGPIIVLLNLTDFDATSDVVLSD
jgi:hypothetical protein